MKIIIVMGHPKDVHLWKNVINNLEDDGHEVKIAARGKDITLYLLDAYGFDYEIIGTNYETLLKKSYGLLEGTIKLLKLAKKFNPDIIVHGGPYAAYVSKLIRKPQIDFIDTEHAKLTTLLSFPFSDVICTPSCFKKKINSKKHIMFDGYQELAYLHPNYFTPNPSVLDDLGLSKDDKFIVVRFVSWGASHDRGQRGFADKENLVKELERHSRVLISSEQKLDGRFEKYRMTIPVERVHDLLYYATMYVGEGATMATEAGLLGTPSIYVSSLVGTMGNFEELEDNYKLVYSFRDPEQAMKKALQLLEDANLKTKWKKRKEKLMNEKIDVTKFVVELIENYPESLKILRGRAKASRTV